MFISDVYIVSGFWVNISSLTPLMYTDPSNPQNYNRYSYCLNNPLMYTDPSGYDQQYIKRVSVLQEIKNRNNGHNGGLGWDSSWHGGGGLGSNGVIASSSSTSRNSRDGYWVEEHYWVNVPDSEDEGLGDYVCAKRWVPIWHGSNSADNYAPVNPPSVNGGNRRTKGLGTTNGTIGLINAAAIAGLYDTQKVLNTAKAINATKASASIVSKIVTSTGFFGLGLTGVVAAIEYNTKTANTHTVADVSVALGVTIGVTVAVIFEAPAIVVGVAGFGAFYGIASIAGFGDALDNWTNNWGHKFIYGE